MRHSLRYRVPLPMRLAQEHDHICYGQKIKLSKVNFQIHENENPLGYYDHNKRQIGISKNLIDNFPWWVVLEVLRHEMAHQYTMEVLNDDSSHGTSFIRACEIIAVAPFARAARLDLVKIQQHIDGFSSDDGRDLPRPLRIIKKLEKLCQSSNAHEAATALAMVNKYKSESAITEKDLDLESMEPWTVRQITHQKRKTPSYLYDLCNFILDQYAVEIVFCDVFDAKDRSSYKGFEIIGKFKEVILAEYAYWYIYNNMMKALKQSKKQGIRFDGVVGHNSYCEGYLGGFISSYNQSLPTTKTKSKMPALNSQTNNQLALNKDLLYKNRLELQKVYEQRYQRLTTRTTSSKKNVDASSFCLGIQDGSLLKMTQGLKNEKNRKPGYFIGD